MLVKNIVSVLLPASLSYLISILLNSHSRFINPIWPYSIAYFVVFCFTSNLIFTSNLKSETYTGQLLTGVTIKLLLAFVILAVFSVLNKAAFLGFSIQFISQYILFTTFEIRYLLSLHKTKS